jgi:hypothetical protein
MAVAGGGLIGVVDLRVAGKERTHNSRGLSFGAPFQKEISGVLLAVTCTRAFFSRESPATAG